jgi:hypothetical protein
MTEMFSNCSSLISVDFSNIDTNHNIVLDNMFKNCTKLNFINIKNFKIKEYNTIYERIFINTPINLVICAESSDINKIIETMDNCVSIDCSDDWRKNRKKINLENDTCIDSCDIINKYEYDGKCFDNPINSIQISDNNDDNLYIFCLKEKPYFFIDKGNCNSYCNLYDLKNNRCFIKYNNTEDNDNYVANLILKNILYDIKNDDYLYSIIKLENDSIIIKEKNIIFSLSLLNFKQLENKNDLLINCEKSFNSYFSGAYHNKTFYLLNITIIQEKGKKKEAYEIYYPSDNDKKTLIKFDINLLDNCFLKANITNCSSYSIKNIINNDCLTCDNELGYYALIDDILENKSSFKCYKSKEGYYFDKNETLLKKCFNSCKTCDKCGNEKFHFCKECKIDYINQIEFNGYLNCYELLTSYNINFLDKNMSKTYLVSEFTNTFETSYLYYNSSGKENIIIIDNENFTGSECPKDYPYEIIETHQ